MDYETICTLIIKLCDTIYRTASEDEEITPDGITLGADIGENRHIEISIKEVSINQGE